MTKKLKIILYAGANKLKLDEEDFFDLAVTFSNESQCLSLVYTELHENG